MRIRLFRGASLAEAMAQVRDELGLDALILGTESQGGLVEVTAALEPGNEPPPGRSLFAEPWHVASAEPPRPRPDLSDQQGLLRHNLPPALLAALQDEPLEAACSRLFRFSRLPLDADGAPLLLAGPPGSGKTLTIAKLATRLVMEGHRPMVITADEQRAGAIEQLAAFTRLLGLTLIAAGRPEMLARALSRREAMSPVLIDAPGLDLLEPAQESLLVELISAARAQSALVLPAGMDPLETAEVADAHGAHGVQLLVPTRIDRAARLGGILAACHGTGLALTEAGTSADVADGLTRLTPVTLAARLVCVGSRRAAPPATPPASLSKSDRPALSLHMAAQAGASRRPLRNQSP